MSPRGSRDAWDINGASVNFTWPNCKALLSALVSLVCCLTSVFPWILHGAHGMKICDHNYEVRHVDDWQRRNLSEAFLADYRKDVKYFKIEPLTLIFASIIASAACIFVNVKWECPVGYLQRVRYGIVLLWLASICNTWHDLASWCIATKTGRSIEDTLLIFMAVFELTSVLWVQYLVQLRVAALEQSLGRNLRSMIMLRLLKCEGGALLFSLGIGPAYVIFDQNAVVLIVCASWAALFIVFHLVFSIMSAAAFYVPYQIIQQRQSNCVKPANSDIRWATRFAICQLGSVICGAATTSMVFGGYISYMMDSTTSKTILWSVAHFGVTPCMDTISNVACLLLLSGVVTLTCGKLELSVSGAGEGTARHTLRDIPARWIKAEWLMQVHAPVPRAQDLPSEAYTDKLHDQFVIGVSHPWLFKQHPDPDGLNLELLKTSLRRLVFDNVVELENAVVFYDWASMPQQAWRNGQHDRNQSDTLIFERCLKSMHNVYFLANVVIILTSVPNNSDKAPYTIPNMLGDQNKVPYLRRGWCAFESGIATIKAATLPSDDEMKEIDPKWIGVERQVVIFTDRLARNIVMQRAQSLRAAAKNGDLDTTLNHWREEIEKAVFTNGEEDKTRVMALLEPFVHHLAQFWAEEENKQRRLLDGRAQVLQLGELARSLSNESNTD